MATINEIIKKLQSLEKKHGNKELVIYKSFDRETIKINEDEIYFDSELKEFYIAVY